MTAIAIRCGTAPPLSTFHTPFGSRHLSVSNRTDQLSSIFRGELVKTGQGTGGITAGGDAMEH